MTNAIKVLLQMQSGFLQLESTLFPNLDVQMPWMHGSIFGCIYNLKFSRNSAKPACRPFSVIENTITKVRFDDLLCSEV
jgi:hypothetical protein